MAVTPALHCESLDCPPFQVDKWEEPHFVQRQQHVPRREWQAHVVCFEEARTLSCARQMLMWRGLGLQSTCWLGEGRDAHLSLVTGWF